MNFKDFKNIKEVAKKATEKAKNVVMENVDEETKKKIKDQVQTVKEVISEEKEIVKEKISDIKEQYSETKEEDQEQVSEENDEELSDDEEVVYDFNDFFTEEEDIDYKDNFFGRISDDKKEIIDSIIEKGKVAINKSKEFINDKIDFLKGTFYIEDVDDLINGLDGIEDDYDEEMESQETKNKFQKIYDGIDSETKEKIKNFINGTKSKVKSTIEGLKRKIENTKKMHRKIKKVRESYKSCKGKVQEVASNVKGKTKKVAEEALEKVENVKVSVTTYTSLEKEEKKNVNDKLLNVGKNATIDFFKNLKEFALKAKENGAVAAKDIEKIYKEMMTKNSEDYLEFKRIFNNYNETVSNIYNTLFYSNDDEFNLSDNDIIKLDEMINKAILYYENVCNEYQKFDDEEKKKLLWVINGTTKLLRESIYEYTTQVSNSDILEKLIEDKEEIFDLCIANIMSGDTLVFHKESFKIDKGYDYILTAEGHTKQQKSYVEGIIYTNVEAGLKSIQITHNNTNNENLWLSNGDYDINSKLHIVNCMLDDVKSCDKVIDSMRFNKLELDSIIEGYVTKEQLQAAASYYHNHKTTKEKVK